MRYLFVILLMLIFSSFAITQTDIVGQRISAIDLNEVRLLHTKGQQTKYNNQKSVDIETILIDLIPKIVKNNRKLRYKWDKSSNKSIKVYQHLIWYDSVSIFNQYNISSRFIDTSFSLISFSNNTQGVCDLEYTNLQCLDSFKYNFEFLKNPDKADFIISSIKGNSKNDNKMLYVWSRSNGSEITIYKIEVEMPWDIDCYKSKIISESKYYIDSKLISY
ncbi:MAG TPA: hypothetical protein PKD16_19240 [Saprospiraceae bacterium]|nr:hypothetical protein [Saprospiraceae bacterium]HMT72309.1 hypothetical protein [Saprospiraceae bacterium]